MKTIKGKKVLVASILMAVMASVTGCHIHERPYASYEQDRRDDNWRGDRHHRYRYRHYDHRHYGNRPYDRNR